MARLSVSYTIFLAVAVLLSAYGVCAEEFLLSSAVSNSIVLLDSVTGLERPFIKATGLLDHPDSMVFHPSTGRLLVSTGKTKATSKVLQFDARTGEYLGRFDDGTGPLQRPYGLAFTKDGKELLVSSFATNNILRYDATTGRYLGTLPSTPLLKGPNALLVAPDGYLYVTTEGSLIDPVSGNVSWPFASQIIRFDFTFNLWQVFAPDARRFATPNQVAMPNYLGLALSPYNDGILWATDFSNGVLAFDLARSNLILRIETSFTGLPSINAIGGLAFLQNAENSNYTVLIPGFLPKSQEIGGVMRFELEGPRTPPIFSTPHFLVRPTTDLLKPIVIVPYSPPFGV